MSYLDKKGVVSALEGRGFIRSTTNREIFILSEESEVSPAYCLNIVRKQGMARLGGALGLYFRDFEDGWKNNLLGSERAIDFTLPIIMHTDNFVSLLYKRYFEYTDDLAKISDDAKSLCGLLANMPISVDEFDRSLTDCKILGKNISDYLHIFDYNQDDNLYFRKSASFIGWFIEKWPQYRDHICNCLTPCQKERLASYRL